MTRIRLQTRKRTADLRDEVTRKRPAVQKARVQRIVRRTPRGRAVIIDRVVVKDNPLQPRARLYTKIPTMNSALQMILTQFSETMREKPGKLAPHSVSIHADSCSYGVLVWPRACDAHELEYMQDAIKERDESCSCIPLVMYIGATA